MFEVTARLKIRDGELEGFKHQAAEVMRLTRENDTKTLRYDWFIQDDGVQCEVREGYIDPDGLLEHNQHVKEARDKLFRDYASDHDMTIHGEPSPELVELMESMSGHVMFHRYFLWQGLDSDDETRGAFRGTFEATAHLTIREGQLEEFKHQVAEITRQARELEDPPLRYDWFLSDDGTECELREAYVDADALLRLQQEVAEVKMKLLHECVAGHAMTFYGDPSPALAQTLAAMGATFTVCSLLQGLDIDIDVFEEVPA